MTTTGIAWSCALTISHIIQENTITTNLELSRHQGTNANFTHVYIGKREHVDTLQCPEEPFLLWHELVLCLVHCILYFRWCPFSSQSSSLTTAPHHWVLLPFVPCFADFVLIFVLIDMVSLFDYTNKTARNWSWGLLHWLLKSTPSHLVLWVMTVFYPHYFYASNLCIILPSLGSYMPHWATVEAKTQGRHSLSALSVQYCSSRAVL